MLIPTIVEKLGGKKKILEAWLYFLKAVKQIIKIPMIMMYKNPLKFGTSDIYLVALNSMLS